MKFSIWKFWQPTPAIFKKIGYAAMTFNHIITVASIGGMLYGNDSRLYSHFALWSLIVGAACKAFTDCFYDEDTK